MTRITNFGRKRAHVEATFNYNEADFEGHDTESSLGGAADGSTTVIANAEGVDAQPPKKKRKRGPRKKAGTKVTTETADGGTSGETEVVDVEGVGKRSGGASSRMGKKNKGKSRTLRGSSLFAISACSKFTRTPLQSARTLQKNGVAGE